MEGKYYKIARTIELTLCEGCNLNCIYCYEKQKRPQRINLELAKEILTREMLDAKKKALSAVMIYFHGGEICLCFDLLKQICEWLWAQKWEIPFICSATTNGTLVHGKLQDWFSTHSKRFILGLSLDGNRIMHNTNRNNSYDLIDLPFFLKYYPEQTVKMTISPQTIKNLSQGVIDIVEKGFKLSANLAYGCEWNEDLKYVYAQELFTLTNYFLIHPQMNPPKNLYKKDLTTYGRCIYMNKLIMPQKHCGAGSGMCCYDMLGSKYPCQMFMPSSTKRTYPKEIIHNDDLKYDKECVDCSLSNICSTCIGQCFSEYGELLKKPDVLCDFHKIEILNYTYFLFGMLQDKDKYAYTRNMNELDVALNIIAISHIQKLLKDSNIAKYVYGK